MSKKETVVWLVVAGCVGGLGAVDSSLPVPAAAAPVAVTQPEVVAKEAVAAKPVGLLEDKKAKPRQSINTLKEEIGYASRDLFAVLTSVNRQAGLVQQKLGATGSAQLHTDFGCLQVHIADMHHTLSAVLQALLDNQPPFKKAKRAALEACLQTLKTSGAQCKQVEQSLKKSSVAQLPCTLPPLVASVAAVQKTVCADELVGAA